jgi:predicted ATPase
MITSMRMKHFKSWKDTGDIRLGSLTGFFGTNSSGKTSLLQMLLLLKQTVESSNRHLVLTTGGQNSRIDLGLLPDIIHNRTDPLEIALSWALADPIIVQENDQGQTVSINHLTFTSTLLGLKEPAYVDSFMYQADNIIEASMRHERDDNYSVKVLLNGKQPKRPSSRPIKYISKPVKCYGFSSEALRFYQNTPYLSDLVLALENLFSQQVFYLGPLRDYPQRIYNWAGEQPEDVGQKGELAVAALLASRNEKRGKGKKKTTLDQQIAEWLKKMGMIDSFRLVQIKDGGTQYELKIRRSPGSAEVLITEMGFGISQVLPVLVLCYYAPEGSTIILEQPEIHLHPAVHAVLADVFIDAIQTRRVQIIVESHSEHLLRRLQRRIAEQQINADQTALYFCEIKQGVSQLNTLEIDIFGNIRNWPKDFFGDISGDLIEMVRAGLKRQPG